MGVCVLVCVGGGGGGMSAWVYVGLRVCAAELVLSLSLPTAMGKFKVQGVHTSIPFTYYVCIQVFHLLTINFLML